MTVRSGYNDSVPSGRKKSAVHQFVVDQPVKDLLIGLEQPAEMDQAGGAERIPPDIAAEPGEFIRRMPVDRTAPRLFETTDFIDDAGRIEKGMEMIAVHRHSMPPAGNHRAALPAYQGFLGLGAGIIGRIGIRGINRSGFCFFPADITAAGGPSIRVYDSGQQ